MSTPVDVPPRLHTDPVPEPPKPSSENYFNKVVTFVSFVYLLRVPLLIATFIFVLLPLAALWFIPSLLENLFVLSVQGTFWTTVMSLALCWSLLLTARLVLLNGYRFRMRPVLTIHTMAAKALILICLLAVPLLATQFVDWRDFGLADPRSILWRVGAILVGALFAYLMSFLAMFISCWIAPVKLLPPEEQFPAPKFLQQALRWADKHCLQPGLLERFGAFLKSHLPKGLWVGYLDPATGVPWGGHWLAFFFGLATAILTYSLDLYRRAHPGESSPVPAICYVLILLLNLNWILSFLSFLLDRYRVPIIVPLLILCVIGARLPSSDHYYRSQAGVAIDSITPYDVLHARMKAGKPIILVATAGGGIQAAAWTTQVLSGLQLLSRTWNTQHSFADSLTLVSSVSGGATGSMYFLNLYGPDSQATFQDGKIVEMNDAVKESSLDDVAWALVYRDFSRIFLPLVNSSAKIRLIDRGYALEETWRNRGVQANLSNWRLGVKDGFRPAVIFNSTVSETGEPLLLSTTDLAPQAKAPRRISFCGAYQNTDLPLVTAVRLAATFPYVTPAARIDSGKPENHMIDGGYYDNPGVSSLVEWLDQGLQALEQKHENPPDHILIIQIRSFPDEDKEPDPTDRGWFFQTFAPIKGLLSVRTTGQLVHDHDELDKLARIWTARAADQSPIEQGLLANRIRFATFTFPGNDAPLSWAMNESQKSAIDKRWREFLKANGKDLEWVRCTLDETNPECASDSIRKQKNGPY